MNASDYYKKAISIIQKLHEDNIIPILVGGSGFYLRSLIKGMYKCPTISNELKKRMKFFFKKKGFSFSRNFEKNDPYSYKNLHPNDSYRIIRATEFFQLLENLYHLKVDSTQKILMTSQMEANENGKLSTPS